MSVVPMMRRSVKLSDVRRKKEKKREEELYYLYIIYQITGQDLLPPFLPCQRSFWLRSPCKLPGLLGLLY